MFTPDPPLDHNKESNKCVTDDGTSRHPAGAAPAGDIGGTNPGIITTTLLTRENLQQKIYFGKYFWGHKYFLQRNISC